MPRKSDRPYKAKANLDVLFGEEESQTAPQTVPIDSITLPVSQPRRYFDPTKMEQLIASVKAHGVLENLLIRPLPDKDSSYELIAGERRYRAALSAGLKEVPVAIRSLSDEQALQISLVENLIREDLNPVEQTEGILQLLALRLNVASVEVTSLLHRMRDEQRGKVPHNVMGNSLGQTIQAVFEELGSITWESFVSNRLPLLNLPSEILEALQTGKIAYTKAIAIARVKDDEVRQSLLEEAIEQDLPLRQIRQRIKAIQFRSESKSPSSQFDATTRRLRAAKPWENPKKWKRVQELLEELEFIIEEDYRR
ncbi:ParB/RepB/Spo0J family partition protein [Microcoleus sp. FACHB-53]|nr:ParB/RepB/Spo0J family partition protein [Microcoleus sp. FACHB-53]